MNHLNIKRQLFDDTYTDKLRDQHIDRLHYNLYRIRGLGIDIKINNSCYSYLYKFTFDFALQRLEISSSGILIATFPFSELKTVSLCCLDALSYSMKFQIERAEFLRKPIIQKEEIK
jgi:hypothetical protein